MTNENVIRKNPLFELYVENGYLIINNTDYYNDNGAINISDIISLEISDKSIDIFETVATIFTGFNIPKKSCELNISTRNGIKEIILTDCDIEKTEKIIYTVNLLISK